MVGYLWLRLTVGAGVGVEAQRLGPGPHEAGQQDGEDIAVDDLPAGLLLSLVLFVRIVVAVEALVQGLSLSPARIRPDAACLYVEASRVEESPLGHTTISLPLTRYTPPITSMPPGGSAQHHPPRAAWACAHSATTAWGNGPRCRGSGREVTSLILIATSALSRRLTVL